MARVSKDGMKLNVLASPCFGWPHRFETALAHFLVRGSRKVRRGTFFIRQA